MKFPRVYPLTIPNSHRMMRMTAIVSSMVNLLRARGADCRRFSNARTTPRARHRHPAVVLFLLVFAVTFVTVEASAQDAADPTPALSEHPATAVPVFLGGAAAALGLHEGAHVFFDVLFDAHPGLKKVDFHGIPFFAIVHESGLPHRKEFVIDSAGFWMQEAGDDLILSKRPGLRDDHAPFLKGMVAFNVLASAAYAGAAFARTGPFERDTRGMADSLRWKEPFVGALILAPAILDAVRYYQRNPKWAMWASRGMKVFSVVLVFR
jgi:hypothetical protein